MTELIEFFNAVGIDTPSAIFWAAVIGALWRMDNRMTAIERSILVVSESVTSEKEQNGIRWEFYESHLEEQIAFNREQVKFNREMQFNRCKP